MPTIWWAFLVRGETGIRTPGTPLRVRLFSKQVLSATQAPLHCSILNFVQPLLGGMAKLVKASTLQNKKWKIVSIFRDVTESEQGYAKLTLTHCIPNNRKYSTHIKWKGLRTGLRMLVTIKTMKANNMKFG